MVRHIYRSYQATGGIIIVIIIAIIAFIIVMQTPKESQNVNTFQENTAQNKVEPEGAIAPPTTPAPIIQDSNFLFETAGDTNIPAEITALPCNPTSSAIDSEEGNMLNLINNRRAQVGSPALQLSGVLNNAADIMVWDQNKNGYNGHTDSTGGTPQNRLIACGYSSGLYSENAGFAGSAEAMFNLWLSSQGHRETLEFDGFLYVGIARAPRPGGGHFWITDFNTENPGGTVQYGDPPTPTPTRTPTPTQLEPTPLPTSLPTQTIPTATPFPSIITPTQIPIQNIGNGVVSVAVNFPGIGQNENIGQNNNPVPNIKTGELIFHDIVSNQSINLTSNFNYTQGEFIALINTVPPSDYEVKLRFNNTLWFNLGLLNHINDYTYTQKGTMITGDINQDNVLDLADYNILLACYGGKQCAQKEQADLNLDGIVDEQDINIFYDGLANRIGD